MPNRVTVQITARDLTRNELARMRRNFRSLGQDMDRVLTNRTRQNFNRLSQSITQTRRDLMSLRGAIPDEEFFRLDRAIRQAQHGMRRGFNRTSAERLARIARQVDEVADGFRDLDRSSQIRVRIDMTALRRADRMLDTWRRQQAASVRPVRMRVRPEISRNEGRNALRFAFRRGDVNPIGRIVGGMLSDGIGQGIANGFKGVGPIMAAALLAAIGASLAFLGAALSGILVAALGLAFIGIGGVSAAMSERVKNQWSKSAKSMKKDFAEVGEPMIPVLERAIRKLEDMSGRIAPKLKKALEEAVPFTNQFIDSLMRGFERFGANAFKPIMDAWKVFGPIFGKEFEDFMGELGDSFKEMANLVKEHPEEIRLALRGVFELIDLLVDSITFLAKAWIFVAQNAGDVFGFILEGIASLVDGVLNGVDTMLAGLESVAEIMGLDGPIERARENLKGWRETAVGTLQDAAEAAFGWDDAINNANRKRKLEVDITSWQAQLAKARADLKKTSSQKARAKLEADIKDLEAKIASAKFLLAGLNGRTATTYVNTVYGTVGTPLGSGGRASREAHGGIKGAATGGVRNNLTMVGEEGPELVRLPAGAHVRSNPDTRRFLNQRGGSDRPIQVNVMVDGRVLARAMVDPLRGEINDKGGNVQNVLGRRGS